jgi:hypothetical protein
MVAELSKKSNKFLLLGFFIWMGGNITQGVYASNPTAVFLGWLVVLVGIGLFVYGCMFYAQAKGQNKWLGLLGLANLLGLIILFALPDNNKAKAKK